MSQGGLLIKPFPRVETGIPGLDRILGGGLLKGGIYLIMGTPGTGKTILANQFGFNHVGRGGRALYVSLLSESHSRLFGHLKSMRFFQEERISQSFNFVSAYHVLEKEGLDGLLKTLAQTVRQYRADLLFIDGVASAEELSRSNVSFKKFVHDLSSVLSASGCTAVLLSSLQGTLTHPEHTMVDGIISLCVSEDNMAAAREISITKLRGSAQLPGKHFFRITNDGVRVFPRSETWLGHEFAGVEEDGETLSVGSPGLDELLGGGVLKGSVTSLVGAAGTGKTTFGIQFLAAGAIRGEQGYFFGLYENPYTLQQRSKTLSEALGKANAKLAPIVAWRPPYELNIDEMIEDILRCVDEKGVQRFFFDGIAGIRDGMLIGRERMGLALTALSIELRNRGVTTVFTEETELFVRDERSPVSDHSAITDNILHLRHGEEDGKLVRRLAVIKVRGGAPGAKVEKFVIRQAGLQLGIATAAKLQAPPRKKPRPKK